ncbi:MAG TPA: c-type cytochrome, partial [Vicinamibacterales bacterium]|nr:c-type cytochrome [Vicinamibacterales bacterium]
MSGKLLWTLAITVAVRMLTLTAQAPNQDEVARGRGLFQTRCADCHGIDAKGVHGPDLTVVFTNGATDERVFNTIRRGVPGTEMPASNAPDQELRAIVAYLRSVGTSLIEDDLINVNRANGERLFSSSCSVCHRVNGRGGVLGPDLSRVGLARSTALLTRDIRDAGAVIAPGYQLVTLVTANGTRIRGARKNEDAYSIQIMDTRQDLKGYLKSGLREVIAETQSLMPDFKNLSDRDVRDVVAYLKTLRGSSDATGAELGSGGVNAQDLLNGLKNSARWLQYSGDYTGRRHSPLTQITPTNVDRLTPQWAFQADTIATGRGFESTPLIIDGVIYLTGANG